MHLSRRRFLCTSLTAPLATRLGGSSSSGATSTLHAVLEEQKFEYPHIIRYDSNCFIINGRDTFVFSAAFHYPRCPRALWRDRLWKLKQSGFNTIETYVFWNYHEPEEGRADLSEFEAFIQLVKEMGFMMIVRPGPYVCAEWDAGGFPHWIIAKRFPLRTNRPDSIKWSQHWFNQVLPIIQRNQTTLGGPIIMVQVENEYDFGPVLPDADKRDYIRALARMVWNAGIHVPVITCWTKQVRDRSDADMARIIDTCNFYPRWNILKEVPAALEKLRKEQPDAPLGITELQGGWFSQVGGKLSAEQDGMTGAQLNLLTKTVIERGVTYFNYYMAFGGTNFDWAAKTMTTTYDYAAPIREPGGLWEKYYAARGICCFLQMFGSALARAQMLEGATESTNKSVSVTERVGGRSGVVFVRENANADQLYKISFIDPASPTKRRITVPREGQLVIGAREMKMIPVQVPIAGGRLRYSTAEVLAHGLVLDRHFLILYDEPGRVVEMGLATEDEPQVEGDTLYRYWDPEYESAVFAARVEGKEKLLLFNNHLLIVLMPRERALQSWISEFPSTVVPGAEEVKPMSVPILSDAYLLASSGSQGKTIWAGLDFLPGEHELTVLLPPLPTKCRVDGMPVEFQYGRRWRTARLRLATPASPYQPIDLSEVRTWVERFDPAVGVWLKSPARALEDLGPVPYGYVKYRAQFTYSGQPKMSISTFSDDAKKVFLNGRLVGEASNAKRQVEFDLAPYAKTGDNTLEIAYEVFGAWNGGDMVGALRGIESVRLGDDPQGGQAIDTWAIQRFPAPMRGREIDPESSVGGWQPALLTKAALASKLIPAFTWCRAEFTLEGPRDGWSVPWKLTFEAGRDALLYLNGKFVGRYATVGPQRDFYLPEPYLNFGTKKNVLTIVLAYTDQPGHIRTLRISPYEEFSVRRTRVEFEW